MAELSTNNTALIVIDLQNGFCHPDGSFAQMEMPVENLAAAIPGSVRLVDAARSAGVPVIFTRFQYRPDYKDGGVLVDEILPALADLNSLAAGSWDAAIVDEFVVGDEDFVVDKNRYSAFYGTRLEPMLTSMGITSLVMCGVTTNMCVETSARDAAQRDYKTWVVSDATGELDPARQEHALGTLAFGFCWVASTDDVVAAWA